MNIQPNSLEAYRLFHNGTIALARAEQQGIRIDLDYCERTKENITKEIESLEREFFQTKFYKHWEHSSRGKVNIHSGQQLSNFLYKVKGFEKPHETTSGQGSTDEDALKRLDIPELDALIKIRKLKKIKDTYLENFIREQVNGYIHPSFNLNMVTTYRSSSNNPNFQNVPKRDKEAMKIIRGALFPRPGHLLMEVDYSALEVRIAACYHQDPAMLRYIKDPTSDMHGDMAKQIFKIKDFDKSRPDHKVLRNSTKNGFVFPQFYGDYYKNCAANIAINWCKLHEGKWKPGQGISMLEGTISDHFINVGMNSYERFIQHLQAIETDFWENRFSIYKQWKEKWYRQYVMTGKVNMFTGFTCRGLMSKNDSINYPVQGAAFHCLLWSFNRIDQLLRENQMDTKLIGQIHDAIVLDVHHDELIEVKEMLHEVMCNELPRMWNWIIVPLEVEFDIGAVDASWATL